MARLATLPRGRPEAMGDGASAAGNFVGVLSQRYG